MKDGKKFTLIIGGNAGKTEVNGVIVDIIADSTKPLPVDVMVFEEDTFLVLTVDPILRFPSEHPIRLMTGVLETKPREPGTVVIKNTSWYAVVHDLDAEPTCRAEWIRKAYAESLRLAETKSVKRLGVYLLGSVHGGVTQRESMLFLTEQIFSQSFVCLQKLTIMVPEGQEAGLRKILSELIS